MTTYDDGKNKHCILKNIKRIVYKKNIKVKSYMTANNGALLAN